MVQPNLWPPCVILAARLNVGLFKERFCEEEVGCLVSVPPPPPLWGWGWGGGGPPGIWLGFLFHPKFLLVPGVLTVLWA